MKYTKPDYFDDFKCIAGECPRTCCSGWQIMIDDDSLAKYQDMNLDSVDYQESCFFNDDDNNCVNLNSDGLCRMVLDYGEDSLCHTCSSFPRHVEEFENLRETSLSISCPVVARTILQRQDQVQFLELEDLEFDEEDYDEYEQVIADYLIDVREFLKQLLWDQEQPLVLRCIQMLHVAADFQEEMDQLAITGGDIDEFDVTKFIADHMKQSHRYINNSMSYESYRAAALDMFEAMRQWEYTSGDFPKMLDQAQTKLFDIPEDAFDQLCADVTDYMYDPQYDMSEIMNLQVIQYFLDTYFVGSCYDEYYYGQAQLAVVAGLQITLLFMADFADKRNKISIDDAVRITTEFARELEHSIPNILATEQWMDEHRLI